MERAKKQGCGKELDCTKVKDSAKDRLRWLAKLVEQIATEVFSNQEELGVMHPKTGNVEKSRQEAILTNRTTKN
jgi:hypothetical protein